MNIVGVLGLGALGQRETLHHKKCDDARDADLHIARHVERGDGIVPESDVRSVHGLRPGVASGKLFIMAPRAREQVEARGHLAAVESYLLEKLIAVFALVKSTPNEQCDHFSKSGAPETHREVNVDAADMRWSSRRE